MKQKSNFKRLTALALTLCMVLTMLPTVAQVYADDNYEGFTVEGGNGGGCDGIWNKGVITINGGSCKLYQYKQQDALTWTDVTENNTQIIDLAPAVYQVRFKAGSNSFANASTDVTIVTQSSGGNSGGGSSNPSVTVPVTTGGGNVSVSDKNIADVSKESYYYHAVKWAVENGVTSGTSATTFSPAADCTRAQIVTFLWCYFGK